MREINSLEDSPLFSIVSNVIDYLKTGFKINLTGREQLYRDVLYTAAARCLRFTFLIDLMRTSSKLEEDEIFKSAENQDVLLSHAFVAAAAANDVHTLEILVANGARVETISVFFGAAINAAASEGSLNAFKYLMKGGAGLRGEPYMTLTYKRMHGIFDGFWTPLDEAAFAGQDGIIELILNSVKEGIIFLQQTPTTSFAAMSGNLSSLKLLLTRANGGEPSSNESTFFEREALELACNYGWLDIVRYFLSSSQPPLPVERCLVFAARGGNTAAIQLLLQHGMSLNSDMGGKALTAAVCGGHFRAVELLLDAGANQDMKQSAFKTALMKSNIAMARLLLERGADIYADDSCEVALETSAMNGLEDVVRFFTVELGVNLSTMTDIGCLLYTALSSGHFRIARLLKKQGAKLAPDVSLVDAKQRNTELTRRGPCSCYIMNALWELHPSHRQTCEEAAWAEFEVQRPGEGAAALP